MGGAAGHMAHPFDLGWVNSGSDLLDFFEKARTFIEKKGAAAVKIDGVNVSFKLVGDEHKQFAVDRGSLKSIDIEGITMSRVDDRFPEGHGMRPAIRTLLTILNKALPNIQKELQELGMWDDPSRFLNTEYVAGTTNVTKYDENFLAIHGLSQFYHKIGKSGASKGNERPGMERPEGVKAPSVEVPYDPQVMEALVKKLNAVAIDYGFQVYGSVPTERMKDVDLDYGGVLSQPFTVKVSDDRDITKSLGEWLSEATNPRYKTVRLQDGTKTHALHKQLYLDILNGEVPIVDLIEDQDAEAAIYGAVLMHATRLLGNEVLKALTSPMGNVMDHEGIVMRDEKLFGQNPVKITGEFIVGNLGGGFGQVNEEEGAVEMEVIEDEDADPVGPHPEQKRWAIVPGAFKPPTRGHLGMVEEYSEWAGADGEVIVLISSPLKQQRSLPNGRILSAQDSKNIWDVMTSHLPNVNVQISPNASPLTAGYEFIGKQGPLNPGDTLTLGASSKVDSRGRADWMRWNDAAQYVKDGVILIPPQQSAVTPLQHSSRYMELIRQGPFWDELPSNLDSSKNPADFHASDMRYLLGKADQDEEAVELLEDFTGEDNIFDVLSILGLNTGLNEVSSMSGLGTSDVGDVEGGISKSPWVKTREIEDDNKKEKSRSKEMAKSIQSKGIAENNIVDEVIALIMERGILR